MSLFWSYTATEINQDEPPKMPEPTQDWKRAVQHEHHRINFTGLQIDSCCILLTYCLLIPVSTPSCLADQPY